MGVPEDREITFQIKHQHNGTGFVTTFCAKRKKWAVSEYLKISLRQHAYSNILKILPPKNENFQLKNPNIFHISAQNIDCGYSAVLTSTHNLCLEQK